MIRRFLLSRIAAAERALGAPMDYARFLLDASRPAFFSFGKVSRALTFRPRTPAAPLHVAGLAASLHEDCGTCVQIHLNLARRDRVPAEVLRAVLDRRPDLLPAGLALVYRFTRAVLEEDPAQLDLREQVRAHYQDAGVAEIALAIAAARYYPQVKKGLGFATSCARVSVAV